MNEQALNGLKAVESAGLGALVPRVGSVVSTRGLQIVLMARTLEDSMAGVLGHVDLVTGRV